jgi:hypothetical protein
MGIFDVLEYGAVIAKSDDYGLIVTAQDNRLNLWSQTDVDTWQNLQIHAVGDLTKLSLDELEDAGNRIIQDYDNDVG